MKRELLQHLISAIRYEDLPATWASCDIVRFSKEKTLFGYQQQALRNSICCLWKYYEDIRDYSTLEPEHFTTARKKGMYRWYADNGLSKDFDIPMEGRRRDVYDLLSEFYPLDNNSVSFEHLINRMCFWMATGSGKSLVLVKLIEVIHALVKRREVPPHDILILTHRDDLIDQIKDHVREFNASSANLMIHLQELKNYAHVKRSHASLFKDNELTVFYYRSDNLSDEHKEKIIDFRNYENDGKWYVMLDEAHKGDKEDSKRQHIYSIMCRGGFLFNFSATFTDKRDLTTTVVNFNLAEFIRAGYGKHLSILEQQFRPFRDDEDYTGDEKQKIVLQSLILLTYASRAKKAISLPKLYHRPLLLTLVNSVNVDDADLKLFFRELQRIGKGEVRARLFKTALEELWKELSQNPLYVFEETERVQIDYDEFMSITQEDVLREVYNAEKPADIEVISHPSDKKELAFRLKSSTRPFGLIRIGDISGWLKKELSGYEIEEKFEDESYFTALNSNESEINILMGSRSFYEGWDSNRPNVINYINIGTGEDARKFILQSIGRGIRIEPLKNKRTRLQFLHNAGEIDEDTYNCVGSARNSLETLFVFGTNRNALKAVIEKMKQEDGATEERQLSLFENPQSQNHVLLIPTYEDADPTTNEILRIGRFELAESDQQLIADYSNYIDDKVMLMRHQTEPRKITKLRESLRDRTKYFKSADREYRDPELLLQRLFDYYDISPKVFSGLKRVEGEIKHFKGIKVSIDVFDEVQSKAIAIKDYTDPHELEKQAWQKFEKGEISKAELSKEIKKSGGMVREADVTYNGKRLTVRHIAQHYYLPLITSDDEKIDYINHIIRHPSEVKFVRDLSAYLWEENNRFATYDWWMFSRLDESMDEVFIPYYNPSINGYSKFNPDFVFWMQKGKKYTILFVDPKGTEHTQAYRKIEGYTRLFNDSKAPRLFDYNGVQVKVKLLLRAQDIDKVPLEYRRYWFEDTNELC